MTTHNTERIAAPRRGEQAPDVADTGNLRDRVRWGPIWAGAVVAVPVFLVLQSLFFALGWLDLGFNAASSNTAASIVSGVLALVAFFVGGLVAGSLSTWSDINNGLAHGVLTWALTVVVMIASALLGAGAILGPLGSLVTQVTNLQQLFAQGSNFDTAQALQVVRHTAGWTALALGLAAAAAAAGGAVGSKIWPRRRAGNPPPAD